MLAKHLIEYGTKSGSDVVDVLFVVAPIVFVYVGGGGSRVYLFLVW